jgi:hypothetical protein
MRKLGKKQKERFEKYWNKETINGLITSNVPTEIVVKWLYSILSIKNENEFLLKSEEMKLL